MKNFTLIAALSLCIISWISASVSQYQTVAAQPGEEVTLQCNNISKHDSQTFWSRMVNITKISCVVVMFTYGDEVIVCDGYEKGKFEMESNISTVFLNIKKVDSSDSGLYYCGFFITNINFLVGESDGIAMLTSVILGALTVVLVLVIVGLAVKIRKLQTVFCEISVTVHCLQNLLSDQLEDAVLSFYPTPVRSRRPASEREVETRVIYTASRQTQRGSVFN
uniref:Ig-like domain-containing protein n=1 Tax=Sparus aurata TaxID=8175 RepID=A0A671XUF2_SPAAU